MLALVDELWNIEGVEAVFPNVVTKMLDVSGTSCSPLNDPIFSQDDYANPYEIIGMVDAWKIIKGSGIYLNNVYVGVLDSALYTGTSEFDGKVRVTGDRTDIPSENPLDGQLNHGTMVTQVIGADPENGGMVGVASVLGNRLHIAVKNSYGILPENTPNNVAVDENDTDEIIYEGENSTHLLATLVRLKELVESGQTVINCSFGPQVPSGSNKLISRAYKKFFDKVYQEHPEVVFVAAAGNEGADPNSKGKLTEDNYYPGGISFPNVITVGAVDNEGNKADFSNYAGKGGEVTLSAPGVQMVVGMDLNSSVEKPVLASGTSFSAPMVTSAIALIQSINPELKASEIKEILEETAAPGVTTEDRMTHIPYGMEAGVLRVDAAVLRVIDALREENDLEPYEREFLLDCSRVELEAEGSRDEFTIIASVEEAAGQRVELQIEISGDYELEGKETKTVKVGEEAQWELVLEDDAVFVKVIRLDTNACATMTLGEIEEEEEEEEEASRIYQIGEVGSTDTFEVSITSVYKSTASSSGDEEDEEYVVVVIKVTNISDEEESISSGDFQFVNDKLGHRDAYSPYAGIGIETNPDTFGAENLAPGDTFEGSIIYSIPKSMSRVELHFIPDYNVVLVDGEYVLLPDLIFEFNK